MMHRRLTTAGTEVAPHYRQLLVIQQTVVVVACVSYLFMVSPDVVDIGSGEYFVVYFCRAYIYMFG